MKCNKCKSENVTVHRHEDGKIDFIDCNDCGHLEPYFHLTEQGKEVLRRLIS